MQDHWNAFVNKDLVREPAGSGTLNGLTFAVKDVFDIQGHTSTAGNPDWLNTHNPAIKHAKAIDLLLHNGAKLTGTAHTDELMYSLNGENFHYGTPVNPKASDRIPGGSSSGSAVAVSAGLVDFALGTDTGGSVRIPSSYCGLYGIRPTHGAVQIDGVIPLAKSFDTVGWMTRNSELLLEVGQILLEGQLVEGNFTKAIFVEEAWEVLDEETRKVLSAFIPSIDKVVNERKSVRISQAGLADWSAAFRTLQAIEIWDEHGEWISSENPTFGPGISDRFELASTYKQNENLAKFELREKITQFLTNILGDDGLLVIPTAPGVAPPLNNTGEQAEQYRAKTMQLTCIAGLSGLPQITLPLAEVKGLPVGLSIIANRNQDLKLLNWTNECMKKKLNKE